MNKDKEYRLLLKLRDDIAIILRDNKKTPIDKNLEIYDIIRKI